MTKDRLIYLPLGGAGEIGMNCYVYGYGPKGHERLIVVDLGVTFPNMDTSPGVDLIMPDIGWLADRADRIEGIFITHAHEDHVGAVGLLWARLRAPVFARNFTGLIAQQKLETRGEHPGIVNVTGPMPEMVEAGPFRVGFLPVSHSIPESSSLVIDTPAGRIIHTADFKIDRTPVVGEAFDDDAWKAAAAGGVKALACDSTNVFSEAPGRSEATLAEPLTELIGSAKGLVAATTFASNVARLRTLAEAGIATGRSVVLLGRAMNNMVATAREAGLIPDFPSTVPVEEALDISRENLLLLVTGSQGERRAAAAQLSQGKYLGMDLREGDMFIFSSKTIPGNEREVGRIMNNLSQLGVDVVGDGDHRYHVSGHANRPDLEFMQDLVNPEMVIPMHGEHRHLREHARLAKERGRGSVIAPNGTMVDLTGKRPVIVDEIEVSRTYLDGTVLIGALDGVVRDRIRAARNGTVVVSVIIDEDHEVLGGAWVHASGLPKVGGAGIELTEVIEEEVEKELSRLGRKVLRDDDRVEDHVKRAARKAAQSEVGKKPEVAVLISRLEGE
ncbi:MAG: ribonuclease J [Alphaproteobacteria bacterium]|nr:MAG: ribonuclease J [Alphaproteobacteria bacterium]